MTKYDTLFDDLQATVLRSEGGSATALRQAVADHGDVPGELSDLVNKVHLHAYKVTEDDFARMKAAGYSEDQLFEITVSAATGAGLERLRAGLEALKGVK